MSPSTEKAWYQSGWTMLVVAAAAALFAYAWLTPHREHVLLSVSGVVDQESEESGVFQLRCWHFFPGVLESGRIAVAAQGAPVEAAEQIKLHAFDQWPPNEDHAIVLEMPLDEPAVDEPLELEITVTAANAKTTFYETAWRGNKWSQPLKQVEEH